MNNLERNKAIVRRFNLEFIQAGKAEVFDELVYPKVINNTAPSGFPNGADGIRGMILHGLRPAFPDLEVEIHEMIAERDLVVTRKSFHGTHTKPFLGVEPSNRKVSILVIDIVRINDGKYVDHWGVRDMRELLEQTSR